MVTEARSVRTPHRQPGAGPGAGTAVGLGWGRAFGGLGLALLLLAGCAGSGTNPHVAPTTGVVSPLAHIGAVPATVSGAPFDPATLTGKPVVLWFWAPWCTICRSEAPAVTKVAADFAGRCGALANGWDTTADCHRAAAHQCPIIGTGARAAA